MREFENYQHAGKKKDLILTNGNKINNKQIIQ
jgi:hypothetical protein